MRESNWLLRLGPAIGALVVVALGSASLTAARDAGGKGAPTCDGLAPLVAAGRDDVTRDAAATAAAYRLDPRLDAGGSLAGQRLEIGTATELTTTVELPPESFAAGPFGRLALVGADDGSRSTLSALDATAGCSWLLATEAHIIRRATLDPSTAAVYEFRLDRTTRADLGVWRRDLAGGATVRVVPPLPVDDRYGVTFSTELTWSAAGDALAIQSCGAARCRTRLIGASDGRVRSVESADQGDLIGVIGDDLIAYAACRGLPCPITSVDVRTGETTTLAVAAGLAATVATQAGPQLIHETGDDDHRAFVLVRTDTGEPTSVVAAGGWHLVPGSARAASADRVPGGFALLTADGRAGPGRDAALLRLDDLSVEQLGVSR